MTQLTSDSLVVSMQGEQRSNSQLAEGNHLTLLCTCLHRGIHTSLKTCRTEQITSWLPTNPPQSNLFHKSTRKNKPTNRMAVNENTTPLKSKNTVKLQVQHFPVNFCEIVSSAWCQLYERLLTVNFHSLTPFSGVLNIGKVYIKESNGSWTHSEAFNNLTVSPNYLLPRQKNQLQCKKTPTSFWQL